MSAVVLWSVLFAINYLVQQEELRFYIVHAAHHLDVLIYCFQTSNFLPLPVGFELEAIVYPIVAGNTPPIRGAAVKIGHRPGPQLLDLYITAAYLPLCAEIPVLLEAFHQKRPSLRMHMSRNAVALRIDARLRKLFAEFALPIFGDFEKKPLGIFQCLLEWLGQRIIAPGQPVYSADEIKWDRHVGDAPDAVFPGIGLARGNKNGNGHRCCKEQ